MATAFIFYLSEGTHTQIIQWISGEEMGNEYNIGAEAIQSLQNFKLGKNEAVMFLILRILNSKNMFCLLYRLML